MDIDHFKKVNDVHGHQVGDQILKSIAEILHNRVRETDTLGRWGGEEFLIICPETSLQNALIMAENLRQSIADHDFPLVGRKTCSFGVACRFPRERGESLINRTDAALYTAKAKGRNLVIADEGLS